MKNLGKKGTDKITGFEGVITGKCHYLYGCAQYLLVPRIDKDGKKPDAHWYDVGRVEIGKRVVEAKDVQVEYYPGPEFRTDSPPTS